MAEELAGKKLPVMLSPWSPPAFMKTNGSRNGGGKLRLEYADLWARYICKYIHEYRRRGVQVTRLSIQMSRTPHRLGTAACIPHRKREIF